LKKLFRIVPDFKRSIFVMKYIALLLLLLISRFADAQVNIYPVPAGLTPSTEYTVTVNGKEAFVYASPVPAAYCSFDMRGPVEIVIKAARDIKWVDVRPATAGIKPIFKDSTIKLRLTKPVQLSIELNGSLRTPLFLFANAPEASKPSRTDPSIRYFEGGKVHYAGLIELKSNESVYIEGGAVVVGAIKAKGDKKYKSVWSRRSRWHVQPELQRFAYKSRQCNYSAG
jgi:hypothetical protein